MPLVPPSGPLRNSRFLAAGTPDGSGRVPAYSMPSPYLSPYPPTASGMAAMLAGFLPVLRVPAGCFPASGAIGDLMRVAIYLLHQ